MYKVMFCLRRRADLTREQFQKRWGERHAEIAVAGLDRIGATRYVQNHTLVASINESLRASRDAPEPFDGVVELWFDSVEDVEGTFTRPDAREAIRALLDDEPEFIDIKASPIFVVDERTVWERAE